ncbi:TetR/AcrR family transcriptional regulator [Candidatus Sodalis endolongispinus]|uniref:TetR/AcrR family transcriptional regulator n=1 Tax=Candidatus Sodalis endolongispinus TaxID=2812662 RepID=UPI001FE749FD|nr:TetR/AcrR family transcriptional regulator [Candidatus Sodalis endolongispinus]
MPQNPPTKSVVKKRQRDPVQTKALILAAAMDEFSRLGLGGARIDGIAAKAGVNKRLIYGYFNSKDDLFQAVLEDIYTDVRTAEAG